MVAEIRNLKIYKNLIAFILTKKTIIFVNAAYLIFPSLHIMKFGSMAK